MWYMVLSNSITGSMRPASITNARKPNSRPVKSVQGPGRLGRKSLVNDKDQRHPRMRYKASAPAIPHTAINRAGTAGLNRPAAPSRNNARPLSPEPMARDAAARNAGGITDPQPRRSSARSRAAPARKSEQKMEQLSSRFWAVQRSSSPGVNRGERANSTRMLSLRHHQLGNRCGMVRNEHCTGRPDMPARLQCGPPGDSGNRWR